MASQYISSIDAMKIEHDKALLALTEKSQAAKLKLDASDEVNTTSNCHIEENESSSNEEILLENTQNTINITSDDGRTNMSGLSLDPSSDDDNELIMNTIRQKRREREENVEVHRQMQAPQVLILPTENYLVVIKLLQIRIAV